MSGESRDIEAMRDFDAEVMKWLQVEDADRWVFYRPHVVGLIADYYKQQRLKDSPRLGFAAEVETTRSNGSERTAESLTGQVVESKSDKGSGDSEIAPYPGVIETAAGISLSIPRYNELIEAEQKVRGYDVCDCGHYRSTHTDGFCDGWMPNSYKSSCSCKAFVQAGAEPATTSVTASEKPQACASCSRLASRVEELEKALVYARGLLWKLRNTAKSALTDAKFETDELLAGAHAEEK